MQHADAATPPDVGPAERETSEHGHAEHVVHLASIFCTATAMGLVMAPAAFHRQAERGLISTRLVRVGSRYLQGALIALSLAVGLDASLIALMIFGSPAGGVLVGASIALILGSLWFGYPRLARRRRAAPDDGRTRFQHQNRG